MASDSLVFYKFTNPYAIGDFATFIRDWNGNMIPPFEKKNIGGGISYAVYSTDSWNKRQVMNGLVGPSLSLYAGLMAGADNAHCDAMAKTNTSMSMETKFALSCLDIPTRHG